MPKDLLFLSLEHWDDIWRRNQFVCATLARRHPDMKILFSGPARDVSHAARRLKDAGGIPAYGNQRAAWDAGARFDFENPEYR